MTDYGFAELLQAAASQVAASRMEALEGACWDALLHGWVIHVHEPGWGQGEGTHFIGIELAEPEEGFAPCTINYWQGGARWL